MADTTGGSRYPSYSYAFQTIVDADPRVEVPQHARLPRPDHDRPRHDGPVQSRVAVDRRAVGRLGAVGRVVQEPPVRGLAEPRVALGAQDEPVPRLVDGM